MATAPNEDGQYVWLLTPPDPAPAAERRAWDRLFKNGSLFERRDIDVNDPLTSPSMVPSFPRDDNVDLAPAPLPPPHHDDSSAPIHTSELETPSSQQEPSSRDRGRTSETVPGGIYRHAGGPRTPSALIGQRGGDTEITLGHLLEPDPTPLPSQGRAYDLQLYTARISMMHKLTGTLAHTLKRQEVPGIYRRLVLDTASNTSWLYALNYRIAHDKYDTSNPAGFGKGSVPLYTADHGPSAPGVWIGYLTPPEICGVPPEYEKEVYPNHGYTSTIKDGREYIDPSVPFATGSYLDTSKIYAVLAPHMDKITLHSCYKWGAHLTPTPMTCNFRFAAAFGVSLRLHHLPIDGLLGLGTSQTQGLFPSHARNAPSLLNAIKPGLRPAHTGEDEMIVYIALRPPIEEFQESESAADREHWFAFNVWPCSNPEPGETFWSPRIPISPSGLARKNYMARIGSMAVFRPKAGIQNTQASHVMISKYEFEPQEEVAFDTGSSVSFFKQEFVRFLQREVFPTRKNISLSHSLTTTSNTPHYYVPRSDNYHIEEWFVEIEFVGQNSNTRYHVRVPCVPFLAMADPTVTDPSEVNDREGLVYPPPQPAKFNVFGLPFFQSTYVALHNVPQPGSPYVRVAPQWAHERARFCLPAWATAA